MNPHVTYLPAAYDAQLHTPFGPSDESVRAHDVVLVATAFRERIVLLSQVDWSGIDLGLYGDWRPLASRSKLRRFVRSGIIDNAMATALYRKARIGLNLYRDGLILGGQPGGVLTYEGAEIVPAESLNPRAYELAATGTFQVSQYRAEVADVFGETVPSFRTPAELGLLLRTYLADPERRRALAERSRHAVIQQSFDERAYQIVQDFNMFQRATRPVAITG